MAEAFPGWRTGDTGNFRLLRVTEARGAYKIALMSMKSPFISQNRSFTTSPEGVVIN